MAHLTLVGLSGDRTRLLLVDDEGAEYTLAVDAALRSALRGEDPRPGQLEIRMESAIRPRDIQARIRAGESPESVAEAAHSTVEKIMPYAAPVLAERAHVAERAQRSSVRRRSSEGSGSLGGGRTLEETVTAHLRGQNVDPGSVEWDAYRREDGRWTLTGVFTTPGRTGTAKFTFDVPGNYVTVEDDDARWLVGELAPRPARVEEPPAPAAGTPRRRLSAVPAEELPLGEDAIEMLAGGGGSPGPRRGGDRRPERGPAGRGVPRRASRRPGARCSRPDRVPGRDRTRPPSRPRRRSPAPRTRLPVVRCARTGAGPRCPAGTRSCSAAAPATEAAPTVRVTSLRRPPGEEHRGPTGGERSRPAPRASPTTATGSWWMPPAPR